MTTPPRTIHDAMRAANPATEVKISPADASQAWGELLSAVASAGTMPTDADLADLPKPKDAAAAGLVLRVFTDAATKIVEARKKGLNDVARNAAVTGRQALASAFANVDDLTVADSEQPTVADIGARMLRR